LSNFILDRRKEKDEGRFYKKRKRSEEGRRDAEIDDREMGQTRVNGGTGRVRRNV